MMRISTRAMLRSALYASEQAGLTRAEQAALAARTCTACERGWIHACSPDCGSGSVADCSYIKPCACNPRGRVW